jgi:hypothetical protein
MIVYNEYSSSFEKELTREFYQAWNATHISKVEIYLAFLFIILEYFNLKINNYIKMLFFTLCFVEYILIIFEK